MSKRGLQHQRNLPYLTEVHWEISVLPIVRNKFEKMYKEYIDTYSGIIQVLNFIRENVTFTRIFEKFLSNLGFFLSNALKNWLLSENFFFILEYYVKCKNNIFGLA